MSIPIYGDANDMELVTTKSRLTLRAAFFENPGDRLMAVPRIFMFSCLP